jgi:hypothetical protein
MNIFSEDVPSLGKDRIFSTHNPNKGEIVDEIKLTCAKLINMVEEHKSDNRLAAMAYSEIEVACLVAVKAVTKL